MSLTANSGGCADRRGKPFQYWSELHRIEEINLPREEITSQSLGRKFLNYCLSCFIKVIASFHELQGPRQPSAYLLQRTMVVCKFTGVGNKEGSNSKPKADERLEFTQNRTCTRTRIIQMVSSENARPGSSGAHTYGLVTVSPRLGRPQQKSGSLPTANFREHQGQIPSLPGARKGPGAGDLAEGKAGNPRPRDTRQSAGKKGVLARSSILWHLSLELPGSFWVLEFIMVAQKYMGVGIGGARD